MADMKAFDNKSKGSQKSASSSPSTQSIPSVPELGRTRKGNVPGPETFLRFQQTLGNKATIQMLAQNIAQRAPVPQAPQAAANPAPLAPQAQPVAANPAPAPLAPQAQPVAANPAPAALAPQAQPVAANPAPAALAPQAPPVAANPAPAALAPQAQPVAANPAPAALAPQAQPVAANPAPAALAPQALPVAANPAPAALAPQALPVAANPAPAALAPQALPVAANPAPAALAPQAQPVAANPALTAQAPQALPVAANPAPAALAPQAQPVAVNPAVAAQAPAYMSDGNFRKLALAGQQLDLRRQQGQWSAGPGFEAESAGGDTLNEALESASSGTGGKADVLDKQIDPLKDLEDQQSENRKKGLEIDKAQVDIASSTMGTLSGFIGLSGMRKAWKEANSGSKKAGVFYEGVENTQKAFSGIAGIIDGAAKSEGNSDGIGKSDAVSGWSGSVGDALSAIKSTFKSVKTIYELISSEEEQSSKDKAKAIASSISNALQAAQSSCKTIKQILEILELGTGGLAQAIPGLGIAISGAKLILKAFNIFEAYHNKKKMADVKKEAKDELDKQGFVDKKSYLFGLFTSKVTDKKKLKARKEALLGKGALSQAEAAELENIEQYELSREMKNINQKRLNRGVTEVGLELMSIAGDIATLSGAGATVGIPLKAAAAATGSALSFGRKIKQMGRDRAAKNGAWGITKAVFNADKSSEEKHKKRVKDAELILDMISHLPEPKEDPQIRKQYERVENYIVATGCNLSELYKYNGDLDKQREILIEAMKQR